MTYYAQNSQEARHLLTELNNGHESLHLTLNQCRCGDGYSISDPIDDELVVMICHKCELEVNQLLNITNFTTNKTRMIQDMTTYISVHSQALEGARLVVEILGDKVTFNIEKK